MGTILFVFPGNLPARNTFPEDTELFNKLNLDLPQLEEVKKSVSKGDYDQAKALLLHYKRISDSGKWKKEAFTQTLPPSDKTDAVADSLCMNCISGGGIPSKPYIPGYVYMGDDFDWLYNPKDKSNPDYSTEWTAFIARIDYLNKLADAYTSTGNEKYLKKWIWFIYDFVKDNFPASGVIWRELDTAIRVRTWINTYLTFRNSELFTAEDNATLMKTVYAHGDFLEKELLSDTTRTGNHVTTECSALYTLGCVFPEFKEAGTWRDVACRRFMKEIVRVVPPDGLQAELSPSYHYGVVAAYRGIYDIAKLNNIPLPDGFISRLQDMYRAPVLLMDQWGDFVKTNDSNSRNIRKSAKEGLDLGYDPFLAWAASKGKKGIAPPTTTHLPYAGFYMMRSGWEPDGIFLFFRGGPQGIGHAEQDMLQTVLKAYGKTLLFDPGKYLYDQSDWRRFSTNTPSHNTIIVDGKWQYREKVIPTEYLPVNNPFYSTPLFDFVSARYAAGYVTNVWDRTKGYRPETWLNDRDTSVTHTRTVIFLKPHYALILDQLNGSGEHTYDAHFHVEAPAARLDRSTQSIISQRKDSVQLAIYPLEFENLQTEIIQGQKNPLLGWYPSEHRPIPTVRFRKQQETPALFATFLYPCKNETPEFEAKSLPATGAQLWGQHITTSEEQVDIVLSKENKSVPITFQSSFSGNVTAEAAGIILRKSKEKGSESLGVWEIKSYKDDDLAFTLPAPATLVVRKQKNNRKIFNAGDKNIEIQILQPVRKSIVLPAGKWINTNK
jgi:hypothetical protein